MKDSASEKIVKVIQKELEHSLKYWQKNAYISEAGEICDDMLEALELCDKLLTKDYFKESEAKVDHLLKNDIQLGLTDWASSYKKDVKAKKKDFTRLFNLVIDRIEDFA